MKPLSPIASPCFMVLKNSFYRSIIQRRRHYEYRMFRRPAKKDDFLRAIEYEKNLNKLKKHRKEVSYSINFKRLWCPFHFITDYFVPFNPDFIDWV